MTWYVQLLIEWAGAMLAQDVTFNAVFACLALLVAFGGSPRVCAALTAVVYLILMMS